MYFHHTYVNGALWDGDDCVKFLGLKVKVQGHSGVYFAGNRLHTVLDVLQGF